MNIVTLCNIHRRLAEEDMYSRIPTRDLSFTLRYRGNHPFQSPPFSCVIEVEKDKLSYARRQIRRRIIIQTEDCLISLRVLREKFTIARSLQIQFEVALRNLFSVCTIRRRLAAEDICSRIPARVSVSHPCFTLRHCENR